MRIIILTFFLGLSVISVLPVSAQQKQLEHRIGWRGNRIELHTISDKAKQLSCTLLANDDSIRAFLLNSSLQITQQFSIPRLLGEQVLGGFIKQSKVFLFVQNPETYRLHTWVLDSALGTATENAVGFNLNNEKVADRISGGDRFLYFTVNKETSEFIIYDFSNERGFTTLKYKFGEGLWKELTKRSGLERAVNMAKVDLEADYNMAVAAHHNKIYLNNDTLFLLMNNHRGTTTVFSFDLNNKKIDTRTIRHFTGKATDTTAEMAENSYLFRNKLYSVHATNDSLFVQISDFYTGETITSFTTSAKDPIAFKNTPVLEEGTSTYKYESRELTKTRQLLRKMVHDDAIILVTPNTKKQIEVMVGSYAKVKASGPVIPVPIPVGAGMVPHILFVNTGGFSRNEWSKSTNFKMLLDADTYKHVDGIPESTLNERIELNTIAIKIPPEAENLFMLDGRYYYAYYDKKERKLVVLKF